MAKIHDSFLVIKYLKIMDKEGQSFVAASLDLGRPIRRDNSFELFQFHNSIIIHKSYIHSKHTLDA